MSVEEIIKNTYRIAVATYDRPKYFADYSLKLLLINGIDLERVDVFIETAEMIEEYRPYCGDLNYIITNTKGLCEKRNFIRHYYTFENFNKYTLHLDDDIECIVSLEENPCDKMEQIIVEGFLICEKENASIFALHPSDNTFFYKPYYTTDLKVCIGAFNGVIYDKDYLPFYTDMEHFEDFDWTLFHFFKDGKTIKLFNYGLKTKYYNKIGGMVKAFGGGKEGFENRKKYAKEQVEYFVNKWGADKMRVLENKFGTNIILNRHYRIKSEDELIFRKPH